MCHRVSEGTAWRCNCGYEFGQPVEQVRTLLRGQRTTASITLAMSIVADAIVGYFIYIGFGIVTIITLISLLLWTVRNVRQLWITGSSLRQLKDRGLPVATIHKG
jgi:hypothetical protein